MSNKIIAIGEALIDFIPDKKGCDFDQIGSFAPAVGGAPANVCGAYTRLGGKSRMLTQLGDDPFGNIIMNTLKGVGIDTSFIPQTKNANTALAFVSTNASGNNTYSFYRKPSADMLFDESQVVKEMFDDCYALHFCSVSIGDFPMKGAHKKAIKLAKEEEAIISFDPNLRFMLWDDHDSLKSAVKEFIPEADILKISDEELEFITGTDDIDKAKEELFGQGVKLIVYTCGKDGAFVLNRKEKVYSPTVTTEARDTTGAGDGFIGSFLWKLHSMGISANDLETLNSEKLKECADFSNRFCSLSVQKKGAIESYPTLDEVNSYENN